MCPNVSTLNTHPVWRQSGRVVHRSDQLVPVPAVPEALGADIPGPGAPSLAALVTNPSIIKQFTHVKIFLLMSNEWLSLTFRTYCFI